MISILYALIYLCEGYIFFYYTNHIFTRRKKRAAGFCFLPCLLDIL